MQSHADFDQGVPVRPPPPRFPPPPNVTVTHEFCPLVRRHCVLDVACLQRLSRAAGVGIVGPQGGRVAATNVVVNAEGHLRRVNGVSVFPARDLLTQGSAAR